MSVPVGDKLVWAASRSGKIENTITSLVEQVEFPDVRALINKGVINFPDALKLRKGAGRFRLWLQDEAERDRNALIAYHHEVAKEGGWVTAGRKALRIFGTCLGAGVGVAIVTPEATVLGAAVGAAIGREIEFLIETATKMNEGWKPVVFGRWARERIEDMKVK